MNSKLLQMRTHNFTPVGLSDGETGAQNREPTTQAGPARADFDWTVYGDATLAGLSLLIPLPFLDSAFESFFRRRMAPRIARRRGHTLHPAAGRALNRVKLFDAALDILLWPFRLLVSLIVRLSRKILYFLTVKKAIDALTYYWQRAFLLDYMAQQGYLSHEQSAPAAVAALDRLLDEVKGSPLRRLAWQIVVGTPRTVRTLWRARQGQEDQNIVTIRSSMARAWGSFGDYFDTLAIRYEEIYQTLRQQGQIEESRRELQSSGLS